MNKKQVLLIILFTIGIVFVISGIELKDISIPLTEDERIELGKKILQSKFCPTINSCPMGPFPSKSPYMGIGQLLHYAGIACLISGAILSIRSGVTVSRRFLSHWIFFAGIIMTSAVLVVLPVLIPQMHSEPFCIEPLCPIGPYWTTDPTFAHPLLFSGIAVSIMGCIIYLTNSNKT